MATYAAQNLWNYRPVDPSLPIENPANFFALTTFTGSTDESWFYAIPAAIEARGAPIIPLTIEAFCAASSDESEKLTGCLQDIRGHIEALTILLPRMYENCNPAFFYHKIRPFLAGSMSAELPKGVFYDQGDGTGNHRLHQGPTAAQSSLFHFLDISFGVSHHPTGSGQIPAAQQNDEFLKVCNRTLEFNYPDITDHCGRK